MGLSMRNLPDLKYSNPACGARWSKVEDYPAVAKQTITRMTGQDVPVIVRILLLPGHLQCCHLPALRFLASLPTPPLVSIRQQYCPDWQISGRDGKMAGRIIREDAECAINLAQSLGLTWSAVTKRTVHGPNLRRTSIALELVGVSFPPPRVQVSEWKGIPQVGGPRDL